MAVKLLEVARAGYVASGDIEGDVREVRGDHQDPEKLRSPGGWSTNLTLQESSKEQVAGSKDRRPKVERRPKPEIRNNFGRAG